jgi:peroxiredoxin
MPALTAGKMAPEFSLPTIPPQHASSGRAADPGDGKSFSLAEARQRGPVVLAFFKISCPVCQFAFPYVERLFEAYKGKNVTIVGVSQNDKGDTARFVKEYGVKFAVALDDPKSYPASNAYGLTNVPTIFYVTSDGVVEQSIVGWSRSEMQELSQSIGTAVSASPSSIFNPGESVPEFKAG